LSQLESASIDRPVCLAELLTSLPVDCLDILSKKINSCYSERLRSAVLARRTTVEPLKIVELDEHSVLSTDIQSDTVSLADQNFEDLDAFGTIPGDDSNNNANAADADAKSKAAAILAIQRIARGTAAREAAAQRREGFIEEQARLALAQDGFIDIVGDILRNTMFNLLQEASFGEFAIQEEPLKFVLKPDP
jgi:hypothetical protein